ncbi:MAG: PDZ domain-containing protein [Tsuneonella sp.]
MIARAAAAAAAALLIAQPLLAREDVAATRAALADLQADDARLQSIGWRLVTGNARFCPDAHPAIGLLLQDMANYGAPDAMRAAAGIAGDVAVEAVAAGSPAARAGLAPNDEVLAIDGASMAALPPAKAGDWQRLTSLHDRIDAALAADGSVALRWRDGAGEHNTAIAGVPACPTRFELLARGSKAAADGNRVRFGRGFAATGYVEDEFAAAVAHELAHNLLHHRAWLAAHGRSRKNVRLTEREADRLMPWLLANAGYDPQAAVRFFKHWGPGHDGWIFRARDHDGWDERAEFAAAEIPQVQALMASEGAADWPAHFRREVNP